MRIKYKYKKYSSTYLWPVVFIGPLFVGLIIFYIYPIIRTFYLSFQQAGAFGGYKFIGIENYQKLVQDPDLLLAIKNTFIFTLITLLGIPLAVIFANMLNTRGLKGKSLYRTLYFLPVVTMPAAVAIVWRMIYNGDYGIINQALAVFGIPNNSWLTNPDTALICIALVAIWMGIGTNIVIFLAGLQSIPDSILEAADLDGAGPIRKFWSITAPLLSPSIFFVSVISVIGALQVFDLIYVMMGTSANPAFASTRTIVYLFYQAGFINNEKGYAAAIAFFLLSIILLLTVFQFRLQKKWVHYE